MILYAFLAALLIVSFSILVLLIWISRLFPFPTVDGFSATEWAAPACASTTAKPYDGPTLDTGVHRPTSSDIFEADEARARIMEEAIAEGGAWLESK